MPKEGNAMNILLISPAFPDTFWSFKHAVRFIRKKAVLPPLGLLTVAAMLPEHWRKRVIDVNVRPLATEDLDWADCAFIGAMAVQRESAAGIIQRCADAGLITIAGGPLFTMEHEAFPAVNHFVLNEAELTLPDFLKDFQTGCAGRVYRTAEFADLRTTPQPAWGLIDLKCYASMSIQFSRGCPFDCDFCNVTALFGRRVRRKSAGQIVAELDGLYRLGWRGVVFFADDNFIGNKAYLKKVLLPALIAWRRDKKGFPFNTEASINLADDPVLMSLMAQAGFSSVFIGIETPDETGLAECNKKQNAGRDLLENIRRIQRAGMEVQGGFIVGFDSDTRSIFKRQIDFIQRSGIVTAMVGLLQAPQGTRLHERLQKEKRLLGAISGDNVDGTTNFVPKMGLDTLVDGYKALMRHLYTPRQYYRRVLTYLREVTPTTITTPMDFQRFMAFFRSCVYLGVFSKERLQYWKLFGWTLFRRPRLLSEALTLAIKGYHFRKVCEHNLSEHR
jgi:radical SAM superfamily enzyme YgiQ (UPF0313 family)